jgi:hypothetical protein
MILDGGACGRIVGLGSATHWIVTIIIAMRRPNKLTRVDFDLLHHGYIIFAFGVILVDTAIAAASNL